MVPIVLYLEDTIDDMNDINYQGSVRDDCRRLNLSPSVSGEVVVTTQLVARALDKLAIYRIW